MSRHATPMLQRLIAKAEKLNEACERLGYRT